MVDVHLEIVVLIHLVMVPVVVELGTKMVEVLLVRMELQQLRVQLAMVTNNVAPEMLMQLHRLHYKWKKLLTPTGVAQDLAENLQQGGVNTWTIL
jgi:hypothetical protein